MTYSPLQAPARFFATAPEIVRKSVLVIHGPHKDTPCPFDILFKPESPVSYQDSEIVGLDFDEHGARGCHFFLRPWEAVRYRDRNRRKRVAWSDLPEATRRAIVAYLESE